MGSLQGAGGAGLGETEINQPRARGGRGHRRRWALHSPGPPLQRMATCTFPPQSVPFGCEARGHPALGSRKGGQGRADVGTSGPPSGISPSRPQEAGDQVTAPSGPPAQGECVPESPPGTRAPHGGLGGGRQQGPSKVLRRKVGHGVAWRWESCGLETAARAEEPSRASRLGRNPS